MDELHKSVAGASVRGGRWRKRARTHTPSLQNVRRVPLSPSIRVGLLLVGEMAFAFQLLSGLAQLEGKVGSYGNVPDWNSTPP